MTNDKLIKYLENKQEDEFCKEFKQSNVDAVLEATLLKLALEQNLKNAAQLIFEKGADRFLSDQFLINLIELYGSDKEILETILDAYGKIKIPFDAIKNLMENCDKTTQCSCLLFLFKNWEKYWQIVECGEKCFISFAVKFRVSLELFKKLLEISKDKNCKLPIDFFKNLALNSNKINQEKYLMYIIDNWDEFHDLIEIEDTNLNKCQVSLRIENHNPKSLILFAANIGVNKEIFITLLEKDKITVEVLKILCENSTKPNQRACLLYILKNWNNRFNEFDINCLGAFRTGILDFLGTSEDKELIENAVDAGASLVSAYKNNVSPIENMETRTVELVLDACISLKPESNDTTTERECGYKTIPVIINYESLVNVKLMEQKQNLLGNLQNEDNNTNKLQFNDEPRRTYSDVLSLTAKLSVHRSLLEHPVMILFRDMQWERFSYYLYTYFSVVVLFLIMSIIGMYIKHFTFIVFYIICIILSIIYYGILINHGLNYKKILSSNLPFTLTIMLLLIINSKISNSMILFISDLTISFLTIHSISYLISNTPVKFRILRIIFFLLLIGYFLYIFLITYSNLIDISQPIAEMNATMTDMMKNTTNLNSTEFFNAFNNVKNSIKEQLDSFIPSAETLLKFLITIGTIMYMKFKHDKDLEIIKFIDFVENVNFVDCIAIPESKKYLEIDIKMISAKKKRTNHLLNYFYPPAYGTEYKEKIRRIICNKYRRTTI